MATVFLFLFFSRLDPLAIESRWGPVCCLWAFGCALALPAFGGRIRMIEGIGFLGACIVALWGGCYGSDGAQHGIGDPVGRVNVAMGLLALLAFVMVWVGGALPVRDEWDRSVREAAKGVD